MALRAKSDGGSILLKSVIFFATAVIFILVPSNAQEDDYLNMSLEDLLDVEIKTASKKSESIEDAPGIVSLITRAEIEQMGARNILDVLERVPGIFSISSYILPHNAISIRGDFPGHTSAHVLYLINGRPIRDSLVGGFNTDVLTSFPLSAVAQVEIIRGPGSVLYGTNAYSGVVNIITETSEERKTDIQISGGSFDRKNAGLSMRFPGKVNVTADFQVTEEDGWTFVGQLSPGQELRRDFSQDMSAAVVTLSYEKLNATAYFGENSLGAFTSGLFPSTTENQRFFLDLGYQDTVSDSWQYSVNLTYNRLRNFLPTGPNIPASPESDDMVFETTHEVSLSEKTSLLIGGSLYNLTGQWTTQGRFTVPEYDQTWWNTYFQLEHRSSEKLKFVLGGQANKVEGVDLDFVPRVGAIFKINDRLGGKLLYGEAFRAAFPGETEIDIPGVLLGTESLVPETIKTLDAQLYYQESNFQAALTLFDSTQDELITRIPSPNPDYRLEFTNRGSLDTQGFELEARATFKGGILLTSSLTHHESENQSGLDNPQLIPQTLFKLSLSRSSKHWILALNNTHVSKAGDVARLNPNVANVNPPLSDFNDLSGHIRWRSSGLINGIKTIHAELYGYNLLDEEILYPEFLFRRVNSFPGRSGRGFVASLGFTF